MNRALLRQRGEAIDTAAGDTKVYDAIEFALRQVPQGPSVRDAQLWYDE